MAADPSVGGSANGSVTAGSGGGGVEVKRTQAFLVECGEVELKLTAKESALGKPFAKAILEPFIKAHNKRTERPVELAKLEAVRVDGRTIDDLNALVSTFVSVAEVRKVELLPPMPRDITCICDGLQMSATVGAPFVDRSLFEAVLSAVLPKFAESLKRKLTQADVERVEVNGERVNASAPVYAVLPRGKTSKIELIVPPAPAEEKATTAVFRVKCNSVELKLTLPPKLLAKPLREAVVEPFLKAYSKKAGRSVTCHHVERLLADGLGVADSCLASSVAAGAALVRLEILLRPLAGSASPTKSYEDWGKLALSDSDDDEEGGAAKEAVVEEIPRVDGSALLRDPAVLTGGWREEAESLFALSAEKVFGFGFEYPANQIEDLVELRAGVAGRERVAAAKKDVSECVYCIKPGAGRPGAREVRCVLYVPQLPKLRKPKQDKEVVEDSVPEQEGVRTYSMADRANQQRRDAGMADDESTDQESLEAARRRREAEEDELWDGIERHPAKGRPLVILAHGGRGHARSAHELWLAWYLVKQYRCCVLAVDYLPHHGVRMPDGSHGAHRAWEDEPSAALGEGHEPWAEGAWEATLEQIADDLCFALEIASIHANQEKQRHRLFNSFGPRGRLVDPKRVAFFGHGLGGALGIGFLAKARDRIAAAALGMCSDGLSTTCHFKQRSTQGISTLEMEIPGTSPAPPAAAFAARILADAAATTVPVHWVANENDPDASLEGARRVFDALGSSCKELQLLPGARIMSVAELQAQLGWLVERLDIYGDLQGTTL